MIRAELGSEDNLNAENKNTFICRYDAEGLRYEVEENERLIRYIYKDRDVLSEESEDEGTKRYIRGNGRLIASDSEKARTYYHYVSDNIGSVHYVINSGTEGTDVNVSDGLSTLKDRIECHYKYDAFGNVVQSEENIRNIFRFTGEQYDKLTGQYYLKARYYNPVIGRFTQMDTYLGDGLNLYAYVQNNPVKYVDPSGHNKDCPKDSSVDSGIIRTQLSRRELAKRKLVDAAAGSRAEGILIGKDGDVPVYQSQQKLKKSIMDAGAQYMGPTRNNDGEIYHMNTPYGPVEIRIMQQIPGQTNPYLDYRTVIVEQGSVGNGTGVYTYGNGAPIRGAVSKSDRKAIGHTHGQIP